MALVVFTGGARSGKSSAAQALAARVALDGADVTVLVAGRGDVDDEFARRIDAHRASRPAEWKTVELAAASPWQPDVDLDAVVLVDCVGTFLGLAMDEVFARTTDDSLSDADAGRLPAGFEEDVAERLDSVVAWILARQADTIVVTNEVGDGLVPSFAMGRVFRDLLGKANRQLVDGADQAYLCVAGRLLSLTDLPREGVWPHD